MNSAKDAREPAAVARQSQRLDAEAMRDSMLFVSGTLDPTPGEAGRSRWTRRTTSAPSTDSSAGASSIGMLALFDFPNPEQHQRSRE